MLRVLRSLSGLAFIVVSCAALAQPPSPPTPTAQPPPLPAPKVELPPASSTADKPQAPPPAPSGAAPPLQACAVKAFDDYAIAMSVWEHEWAEGVIDARPDFNSAVVARGDAHNSALQRDGYRIHYLAANAPNGLNVDESIASMRLFDWTPEQEQALRQREPDYANVAEAADRNRLAADAQPKSQELETYFEESFTDNAGAGAARSLVELLNHGNDALEHCHERYPPAPAGDPIAERPPPANAAAPPLEPPAKP